MDYPALIFWALIAWTIVASTRAVLILLISSMPFAGLALLPPEVAGGVSILPQSMFAVVLVLKVLAQQVRTRSPKVFTVLQLRNMGFLVLFLTFAIATTVIMPRLFQGQVVIMPMKASLAADLLGPSQQNFTQSAYLTLSVISALAVALVADEPGFLETLLAGVLAGGIVCVATGLVDMAAAATGMEGLLKPFRNAGYSFITEAEIAGVRRVIGLTPEASSYGTLCVPFGATLALLRNLYAGPGVRIIATITAGSLFVMAVLSTSSTAYLELAVFALVYAANWIRRLATPSSLGKSGLFGELITGLLFATALLTIFVARSDLFDPLGNLITEVILNKPLSSSYYERTHLNVVAWDALGTSWGLGVGLGSTRTSNQIAAIVSSTGIIGAALFGLFLTRLFTRRPDSQSVLYAEILPALKLSLVPVLAGASVVSAGADFGLWVGVGFGAICGIAAITPRPSSVGQFAEGEVSPAAVYGAVLSRTRGLRRWRRQYEGSAPRASQ
jgi:hypothetical protein